MSDSASQFIAAKFLGSSYIHALLVSTARPPLADSVTHSGQNVTHKYTATMKMLHTVIGNLGSHVHIRKLSSTCALPVGNINRTPSIEERRQPAQTRCEGPPNGSQPAPTRSPYL